MADDDGPRKSSHDKTEKPRPPLQGGLRPVYRPPKQKGVGEDLQGPRPRSEDVETVPRKEFQVYAPRKRSLFPFYMLLAALAIAGAIMKFSDHTLNQGTKTPRPPYLHSKPSNLLKKDCQRLTEGLLLFQPSTTMRQGQSYFLLARLSRNPDVNITKDLDGSGFKVESASVSCKVSLTLDSQEFDAFRIENSPAGRQDAQYLLPSDFTEWRWKVTPKKSGTLHLLLYVTPILYVDGIAGGLERSVPQQARVITVTPDYAYAVWFNLQSNWIIYSVLLTAIIIPMTLWIIGKLSNPPKKRTHIGFS
jgi:hypothetical protein